MAGLVPAHPLHPLMMAMLATQCKRALLTVLLGAAVVLFGSAEASAAKGKKPPQVQQDPMETENSPPPTPPPTESPDKPGADKPEGSSSASRPNHSGGSGNNSTSSDAGAPEKAGFFMFNVKIGPAFCVLPSNCPHQGSVVLDLGAALTANRNGYLLLPVQFQFLPGASAIIVPIGFQYDVRLPLRGLYIYPRVSVGYAALLSDVPSSTLPSTLVHSGVLIAEFGFKYILRGRWNLGGELVSLPLFFNTYGAELYFRIHLSAGVNF